ncbi:MAG: DNA polymerase III subunit delta [Firmicutes bacterium]|nr:DNA polymerase III subunit delta [Bacillota bacterium]
MKELNKAIKAGDIKPLYLFYGSERFLLHRTLNLLINAVAPGDNPFNLQRLNAENLSLGELLNNANTLPFFAARKLLVVDNCPWFANKKKDVDNPNADTALPDLEELLAYLQNPSDTTVLVFLGGETINKAKKVSKAVAKYGVIQEFSALKGNTALVWLDEQLAERHCIMAPAAKQQLLLNCEYNCTLINNELEKLTLYVEPGREISPEDVQKIVSSNATASIFNLVDSVADGNLAASIRALEKVSLTEVPESILPRLADHFETLYIVKIMQQQGYTTKEIMQAAGKNHPFVIEKSGRQAAKYTPAKLQIALQTLQIADRKVKTGVTDATNAIETAMIQICLLGK